MHLNTPPRTPALMRHLTLATLCLFALTVGSGNAESKTQRNLRLGNSWEFQFQGNPSTGYTWRLDGAASDGLALIKLESLGYRSSRKERPVVVGAPAPFLFRITCLKPGHADLWFQYVGPTGMRSPKRHEVWVRCG